MLRVVVALGEAHVEHSMKCWNQPLPAAQAGRNVYERQTIELGVGEARNRRFGGAAACILPPRLH